MNALQYKSFFVNCIIKLWNELPQSTKFITLTNSNSSIKDDCLIRKCLVNYSRTIRIDFVVWCILLVIFVCASGHVPSVIINILLLRQMESCRRKTLTLGEKRLSCHSTFSICGSDVNLTTCGEQSLFNNKMLCNNRSIHLKSI